MRDHVILPEGYVLEIGKACEALVDSGNQSKYTGGRRWKAGKLKAMRDDGSFEVRLYDGTLENVGLWDIRPPKEKVAEK